MSEARLRRGDVVLSVLAGDYGKPQPTVVVQSDLFNGSHESIVVCPISSKITGLSLFRVPLDASEMTGLEKDSEVMVDKMGAASISRTRNRIGRLSRPQMSAVDAALRLWLELPE
ncbi:MAG: type II toxin-antitoxin system PemK/MazF family toxin [Bryobacteraceae bacterium]